jgi:hypothetical protein
VLWAIIITIILNLIINYYENKNRYKIMNRSKSFPTLQTIFEDPEMVIKKSISNPEIVTSNTIIIRLTGVKILGLAFTNIKNRAVITNIYQNSCASEKISIEYINRYYVKRINDFNFTTYNSIIKFINYIWVRDHDIKLELEEIEDYELTELDIFYNDNNLNEYKKKFYEIGVLSYDDLEYLEYHDFIIMNIPLLIINKIAIKLKINSNGNIYITNNILIDDKQKMINEYKEGNNKGNIYIQLEDGWICI